MERGTTPSPKVKPIIHLCGRPIDNANVMFYSIFTKNFAELA